MRHYLYLLLLALLSSCTVGPDYHVPASQLPAHYSSSHPTLSANKLPGKTSFWYRHFNDPVLVSLIEKAVDGSNFDIQKSLANIREARAEIAIVNADNLPELDGVGKISRDRLSGNSEILSSFPSNKIPLSYTDYRFGFDASWEIDVFGHTRRSVEAARARFQSATENLNNTAIIVAAEVARTYTQYRVYQQRVIIAAHTIDAYTETTRLVKLEMQAGSASAVDLHRAESELLSAKAALPPLQASAKSSLAALAILTGELPEKLFARLEKIEPIPILKPDALSVGLPADLLHRRPDLRIAERELAAATADLGVAVANQFPRFQLIGDLGSETTKPGTYFQRASAFWSVGPQFSIPIFQGGRLKNAVKAQAAANDAAIANYRKAIIQALADVESSMVQYHQDRIKNKKLLGSYNKLKSVRRLIQLQYKEGQASLLDVLDVERQLDTLNNEYVQSLGQVTIDLVALYKAFGGAWGQVD